MQTPQLILGLDDEGSVTRNRSEGLALFKQFFHRFPASFEQRVGNRMPVPWMRTKSLHGICKPLRIVAYVGTETYAPSHCRTCLHNDRTKLCRQVTQLDPLPNELNFFQFTKKSNSLDISFFAADAGHDIEPTNCSLGQLNEALRCDCGAFFGHPFRAVRNPDCDADRGDGANCLNPRGRSSCGHRIHDIPNSESNVQNAKDCRKGDEAEYGPVRKLEIFEHVQSLLKPQMPCELIVVQHTDTRNGV